MTAGEWTATPPVASDKLRALLDSKSPVDGAEAMLCFETMKAFKWVVGRRMVNTDSSRQALALYRFLASIHQLLILFPGKKLRFL